MYYTRTRAICKPVNVINYLYFLVAERALAASPTVQPLQPSGGGVVATQDINTNIGSIASQIISTITLLVGVAAVIYLLWSGAQYIMSAGSPEKTKTARAGIINAVIGIIIVVATYAIIRFAGSAGNTLSGTTQ